MEALFEHVKNELAALKATGYPVKAAGKSIMVRCPFHPDTDPSLSVNVGNPDAPPGVFNCFGCGAHGSWNLLAQTLHLRPFTEEELRELRRIHLNGRRPRETWRYQPPRHLGELPPGFRYGRIGYETLKRYGAKVWVDPVLQEKRLLFIVTVFGETLGHVSLPYHRLTARVRRARYSPGHWVRRALWPYDHQRSGARTIVLVEGLRDALRLLQEGIDALAMLGGRTVWTPYKRELVLAKEPKRIVVLTDGDPTGHRFAKQLVKEFRPLLPVRWFRLPLREKTELPFDLDPYNMPGKYLKKLKQVVEEEW